MVQNFLDFEQPISELDAKIQELRYTSHENAIDIDDEIARLKDKLKERTLAIFQALTPWQVAQLARHPARPYALDYIGKLFSEFHELKGDRMYGDDEAIVGGLARFEGQPVVVVGQQKGRETKEKVRRNFGMPRPEGYRKAKRLFELAERFRLPVLSFIDTPGAYPGVGAEERNQSEAIARNLAVLAGLRVPVVATVIGEGGSGGALAIGIADRVLMLQYAIYSVISPEGCASILWKSADYARDAADALGITAPRLKEQGLIDTVVLEPLGGAHRDPEAMIETLRSALKAELWPLLNLDPTGLVEQRYQRLKRYGRYH